MIPSTLKRYLTVGLVTSLVGLVAPTVSRADPLVLDGWDLFATSTESQFGAGFLRGVPLGSFFFENVGSFPTGNADTIVRRLDSVSDPQGITRLRMEALQLETIEPITFLGVTDIFFYTLQSRRSAAEGGPVNPSDGEMTIVFQPPGTEPGGPPPPQPRHGTFTSSINVFFDIRRGGVNGNIVLSGGTRIDTDPMMPPNWSHFPPPNARLIPGVNFLLNGQTQLNDFFPIGVFGEFGLIALPNVPPILVAHRVCTASASGPGAAQLQDPCLQVPIPEPASLLLFGVGLLGLGGARWRLFRSHRK